MFIVLDSLHQQVNLDNPKYLGFFGTCKMWDDTWKVLEHPEFTDKPFIGGDEKNWMYHCFHTSSHVYDL